VFKDKVRFVLFVSWSIEILGGVCFLKALDLSILMWVVL
jgi:hypothetical protein